MPLYNVEHSFPLDVQHKADLAERLTRLHANTFTTPSVFVQVKFYQQDASTHNHYVGGQPAEDATNRIIGFVRSSPGRSLEDFNKLAKKIEDAWYIVLGEKADGDDEEESKDKKNKKEESATQKAAKELLSVVFIGGLSGREKGFVIPEVCLLCKSTGRKRDLIFNTDNDVFRLAKRKPGSRNTVKSSRNEQTLAMRASKACLTKLKTGMISRAGEAELAGCSLTLPIPV